MILFDLTNNVSLKQKMTSFDKRNRICFNQSVNLEDVDSEWVKRLSKADKKLIQKDLKKFKKI